MVTLILGKGDGKPTLTNFGHMNQGNRIYFLETLHEQAEALGMTPAEISGYETGRHDLPPEIERVIRRYWRDRFASIS